MPRPRSIPGLALHLLGLRVGASPLRLGGALLASAVAAGALGSIALHHGPCGHGLRSSSRVASSARAQLERVVRHAASSRAQGVGARETRAVFPVLVAASSGYGLAWTDLRDEQPAVYFLRLDASGNRVGAERRISTGNNAALLPRLAWSGSHFALAWTSFDGDNLGALVQGLDAQGAPVGTPRALEAGNFLAAPTVAWTGSSFAAAWLRVDERGGMRMRFSLLDGQGAPAGRPRDVRETVATGLPRLVWSGSELVLAMSEFQPTRDRGAVVTVRFNAAGEAGRPTELATGADLPGELAVAADGARAGLVWEQETRGEASLHFASVTAQGPERPAVRLTPRSVVPASPALSWGGSQYALGFDNYANDSASAWLARLDASGAGRGAPVRLTGRNPGAMASVTWDGTAWAAAWVDTRGGDLGLYVNRFDAEGNRVGEDHRVTSLGQR